MLRRKEILAPLRVGKSLFIRLDDVQVRWGISERVEAINIVKPELHDTIDITEHHAPRLVLGDAGLNITAHVALGVRLTRKERRVFVPPVLNVLFMRHVRAAADQYIYLEHLDLLLELYNP